MKQLALAKIRQQFPRPRIDNLSTVIEEQMQEVAPGVHPGMSVTITAGSRGITGIQSILKWLLILCVQWELIHCLFPGSDKDASSASRC